VASGRGAAPVLRAAHVSDRSSIMNSWGLRRVLRAFRHPATAAADRNGSMRSTAARDRLELGLTRPMVTVPRASVHFTRTCPSRCTAAPAIANPAVL